MNDLIVQTLLAGSAVAIVAGPMGAMLLWQRRAYFGETIAHASLFGAVVSVLFGIHLSIGILLAALTVSILLILLEQNPYFSSDTILGMISHSILALGLLLLGLVSQLRINILGLLYGDILAVNTHDIYILWGMAITILVLLFIFWRPLLQVIMHAELAAAEGIKVFRIHILQGALLALFVAIAMKIVGALLLIALMIIPAATSRIIARTPTSMMIYSSFFGILAVIIGLILSLWRDLPTGPAVVLTSCIGFIFAYFLSGKKIIRCG